MGLVIEKVIKFNIPEYMKIFDFQADLKCSPYCICYQYNVDKNGYGSYGFNTLKSNLFLKDMFQQSYTWDKFRFKANAVDNIYSRGINFYGDVDKIEFCSKILEILQNIFHAFCVDWEWSRLDRRLA